MSNNLEDFATVLMPQSDTLKPSSCVFVKWKSFLFCYNHLWRLQTFQFIHKVNKNILNTYSTWWERRFFFKIRNKPQISVLCLSILHKMHYDSCNSHKKQTTCMYKHQECLEKIRGLWNKGSVRNNCIKINYTYHKRWKLHKTDRQANIWRKRAQACDLMDMDKQEFKQDVLWKMKVKSKETGQQVGPVLRVQIHIRHSERWMSKCLSVVSNFLLQCRSVFKVGLNWKTGWCLFKSMQTTNKQT